MSIQLLWDSVQELTAHSQRGLEVPRTIHEVQPVQEIVPRPRHCDSGLCRVLRLRVLLHTGRASIHRSRTGCLKGRWRKRGRLLCIGGCGYRKLAGVASHDAAVPQLANSIPSKSWKQPSLSPWLWRIEVAQPGTSYTVIQYMCTKITKPEREREPFPGQRAMGRGVQDMHSSCPEQHAPQAVGSNTACWPIDWSEWCCGVVRNALKGAMVSRVNRTIYCCIVCFHTALHITCFWPGCSSVFCRLWPPWWPLKIRGNPKAQTGQQESTGHTALQHAALRLATTLQHFQPTLKPKLINEEAEIDVLNHQNTQLSCKEQSLWGTGPSLCWNIDWSGKRVDAKAPSSPSTRQLRFLVYCFGLHL